MGKITQGKKNSSALDIFEKYFILGHYP
jgi:hypothetical protein